MSEFGILSSRTDWPASTSIKAIGVLRTSRPVDVWFIPRLFVRVGNQDSIAARWTTRALIGFAQGRPSVVQIGNTIVGSSRARTPTAKCSSRNVDGIPPRFLPCAQSHWQKLEFRLKESPRNSNYRVKRCSDRLSQHEHVAWLSLGTGSFMECKCECQENSAHYFKTRFVIQLKHEAIVA